MRRGARTPCAGARSRGRWRRSAGGPPSLRRRGRRRRGRRRHGRRRRGRRRRGRRRREPGGELHRLAAGEVRQVVARRGQAAVVRRLVAAHAPLEQLGVERHVRLHRRQRLRAQPRPVDRPPNLRAPPQPLVVLHVHGERRQARATAARRRRGLWRPRRRRARARASSPSAGATIDPPKGHEGALSVAPASATCP